MLNTHKTTSLTFVLCFISISLVHSHKDEWFGLILSHTLQFFNLTFSPFSTSCLPNPPDFSLVSLYISCDIGLESESLPISSGMLTQQPPSACFHSQTEKALSWAHQTHVHSSSLTRSRKVNRNVRCVSPRDRISRSTCLSSVVCGLWWISLPGAPEWAAYDGETSHFPLAVSLGIFYSFIKSVLKVIVPKQRNGNRYVGQRESEYEYGIQWHDIWAKHDLEPAHHRCARSTETGLKTEGLWVSQKQSLCYHGDGNRLEPHLVAISLALCKERKKEIYGEEGGGKYFLQCKAERKQSRVTLERGRKY